MTTSRFDRGHEVIVGIEVSWIFVACLPPRAGWCIIYTWPRVSHTSSSPEWRIIDGGDPRVDDASPPSFARNTSQSTVQVRFLYSNSRSSHRIHPFFRVRSSRLADRINLIAEHGFRFLHSMIDRSIDRSSFSSIFKSNYFFFFMKITKMIYHGIFFFLILW